MQRVWIRDAHDAHAVIVRFLPVQRANRCDQRGRRAGPNQNGRYACATQNSQRSFSKCGPAVPINKFVTTGQFSDSSRGQSRGIHPIG